MTAFSSNSELLAAVLGEQVVDGVKIAGAALVMADDRGEFILVTADDKTIATMHKLLKKGYRTVGGVRWTSEADPAVGWRLRTYPMLSEPGAEAVLERAVQLVRSCWLPN